MELGLGFTKYIPLIIYIVGLAVILLTLFYRIDIGIFFLVPLLTLQNILDSLAQYPGGSDILDFLYLALMAKWFFNQQTSKDDPELARLDAVAEVKKPLVVVLGLIMVWTYLEFWNGSLNLGTGPPISPGDPRFVTWKNFVMLPLLSLIVVHNIKNEKQVKIIVGLMALSMLFMDRTFYHHIAGRDRSHYSGDLRATGTFTYLGPNELAAFYAQNTIILVCLYLLDEHRRRRALFMVTFVFNYFCTIFLYSRSGYLAMAVSLIFLGVVKDRRLAVAMLVFVMFWRVFTPVSVQERIDMSVTEEGTDSSVSARYLLWEQALDRIQQQPVIGHGYQVTPYMGFWAGKPRKSLHNGYLEVILELGVVGMGIFLVFFGLGIRYGWRLYRTARDGFSQGLGLGFIGCILAVLASNVFGSYWFYLNVSGFFYTFFALVVRSLQIAQSGSEEMTDSRPAGQRKSSHAQLMEKVWESHEKAEVVLA